MKLHEAIEECLDSKEKTKIRRESWTHGDYLTVECAASYGGGELYYHYSGERASLFYVGDLISNDWSVE